MTVLRQVGRAAIAFVLPFGALAPPKARAEDFRLGLPLSCEPGRSCFVQHYVDRDPGPGARDFACGPRTYEGHDGTDFRVTNALAAAGPAGRVVAAAPGTVLRVRDGAPDASVRETGLERVAGVECGNGAVLAHADGFETQYCHLASGSLKVRPGERVEAGRTIGQIGLSGATEFPHLHFTVRRAGRTVDPFDTAETGGQCVPPPAGGNPERPQLWAEPLRTALAYRAGAVLNSGFAAGPVAMDAVEAGTVPEAGLGGAALVAWVRAIGLEAGDRVHLQVEGPDGRVLAESREPSLPRSKAQALLFVGRKRPEAGWVPGTYTAVYSVTRGGNVALDHRFTTKLPAR